MNITHYKYVFIFLVAASVFIFSSCSNSSGSAEKEAEAKSPSPGETVTTVITDIAQNKNFDYLIQSNGKIKSLHEQLIISESGGTLLVCNAQTGKKFSAGEMILQLETTSIHHKLQKAKLTQFDSEKEYESQLLGYETLLKDKTNQQAEDIKQKLKISTGLAVAEQDIKEAEYELTKAVIKAPFAGVLADVKVQQGQQLKAGEELFRIYDPHNMLLEAKILEADIAMLKKGTSAQVSPIANPELLYKAAVYEINPYADEKGMAE